MGKSRDKNHPFPYKMYVNNLSSCSVVVCCLREYYYLRYICREFLVFMNSNYNIIIFFHYFLLRYNIMFAFIIKI